MLFLVGEHTKILWRKSRVIPCRRSSYIVHLRRLMHRESHHSGMLALSVVSCFLLCTFLSLSERLCVVGSPAARACCFVVLGVVGAPSGNMFLVRCLPYFFFASRIHKATHTFVSVGAARPPTRRQIGPPSPFFVSPLWSVFGPHFNIVEFFIELCDSAKK